MNKQNVRKIRDVSVVVMVAAAGFSQPAFAYLDPSTGSMILSAILGLFATIGLALKTYWYKLKGFFRGSKPAAEQSVASDAQEKDEPEAR